MSATFTAAQPAVYVCPMAWHTQEFDKPGTCPICGMDLVAKPRRLRVAVLVFDYAEDIDFTAPIEVFGTVNAEVFTVASSRNPIRTVYGLHVVPDYDLEQAPPSDLLVVPGGGVADSTKDDRVISWIRERAGSSRYVMSVCNGAFLIAKAGLLDGLTATTTAGRIDELSAASPKTRVVRRRFVDNGRVITTAGLSAGIDGALHVIDRVYGRARAEESARRLEYRWEPKSKWTRATLADLRLPSVKLPAGATWETVASAGDTRRWEMRGHLRVKMTKSEIAEYARKQLAGNGWTPRADGSLVNQDREGHSWIGTIAFTQEPGGVMETMTVRRSE